MVNLVRCQTFYQGCPKELYLDHYFSCVTSMICQMTLPLELSYMLMMYHVLLCSYTSKHYSRLPEFAGRLVQWADRWQMNFNITKCEMIRITNRIHPVYYTYRMKDHCLNKVSHTNINTWGCSLTRG